MKKLFVFAIAATCVVAACNKNPLPTPEDETPVAVQFNTKTIDASVTRTKAAIETWTGKEELHIYGFAVNREGGKDDGAQIALGSGRYDLNNPFINDVKASSPASGTTGAINVYAQGTEPFYYDINTSVVYDFYGYYYGDAELEAAVKANDAIAYPITIDGTQDVMYATTDKKEDVKNSQVAEHQAYGAWAARRNVQPTLNFKHALSQFTFQIKRGNGSYSGDLTVQSVQIIGSNKGNLTVVGATPGYVAATDDNMNDSFTLTGNMTLTPTSTDYTPVNGALMVAPDQEKVRVKVTLTATNYSPNGGVIVYEFDLQAKDLLRKDGNNNNESAGATKFEAGKSYRADIIVYGPEEVEFDVTLDSWQNGGWVEYDPDNDNNAPAA
ncbi:MAG: fimbrillin family protein [Bacteroidales bacterium]|nr:fimbrillin family protein [Bacteroidales bacterium]MBO7764055.1 fimbrillin family protein [Bacteroidales bacterium]